MIPLVFITLLAGVVGFLCGKFSGQPVLAHDGDVQIGRYQFQQEPPRPDVIPEVYILDTATGRLWRRAASGWIEDSPEFSKPRK